MMDGDRKERREETCYRCTESRRLLVRVAWSTQDSKGAQTIDQMSGSDEADTDEEDTKGCVYERSQAVRIGNDCLEGNGDNNTEVENRG
jgi:hypothetical protein